MKILIACEESQVVCTAFREREYEAYSCDIQECSGGHPQWHIMGDALKVIDGDCDFTTMDGIVHHIDGEWDLIIAHPPCTDLAVSGARHFAKKREDGRQLKSIELFVRMLNAKCKRICVQNPVNIIGGQYIKQYFPQFADVPNCTQSIQPYEFGHPTRKTTCLWLKGLPPLQPTNIVQPTLHSYMKKDGSIATFGHGFDICRDENGKIISWNDPRTAKMRSRTFEGIGRAIVQQWGPLLQDLSWVDDLLN